VCLCEATLVLATPMLPWWTLKPGQVGQHEQPTDNMNAAITRRRPTNIAHTHLLHVTQEAREREHASAHSTRNRALSTSLHAHLTCVARKGLARGAECSRRSTTHYSRRNDQRAATPPTAHRPTATQACPHHGERGGKSAAWRGTPKVKGL
jgi:hypothetical protein